MSEARPRIGILANTLEGVAGADAGGHVHFLEVARRWPWADVVIFAPESGRVPFLARVPGATFVAMPSWDRVLTGKAPLFLFRSITGLLRFRSLRACDVLLATSHFLPDVLPVAIGRGKRGLLTVHHLMQGAARRDGPFVRNAIAALGERLSLAVAARSFAAVLCLSTLVQREVERLGFRQPLTVTTNGVEHLGDGVPPASGRRSGAVFVGRLHPTKGVDDLIRAWRDVVDVLPDARLSLIGAADDAAFDRELDALVHELGLDSNVCKRGRLGDAEKIAALYEAKVFAFASKEEGWGIALAEAMRAGLPCATYALPIFDEIFPIGRLAAPVGDTKMLGKNLLLLLSDDTLNARLAAEASALALDFSWQRAADIEAEVVRSLLRA